VYIISKGQLKPANKKFSRLPNEYELTLNCQNAHTHTHAHERGPERDGQLLIYAVLLCPLVQPMRR
jgi:hypothetical protein